jgi:hypothetical protein
MENNNFLNEIENIKKNNIKNVIMINKIKKILLLIEELENIMKEEIQNDLLNINLDRIKLKNNIKIFHKICTNII